MSWIIKINDFLNYLLNPWLYLRYWSNCLVANTSLSNGYSAPSLTATAKPEQTAISWVLNRVYEPQYHVFFVFWINLTNGTVYLEIIII